MLGRNFLPLDRNPDLEFTTPLSIEECKKRLTQESHRKRKLFGFRYPRYPLPPAVEYRMGNYFAIGRYQSFFERDNLLVLGGQLKTVENGTLVRASFRLYEGISIVVLLGFVVFFGLALHNVIANGAEIGVLLKPVVFSGFAGLYLWLMMWFRKSQREDLATYLKSILIPTNNSRR